MRKRYWLFVALFIWGCGGRRITAPPAIPGLVTIPDAIQCGALAVSEGAVWAALGDYELFSLSLFGGSSRTDELVRIDLDSNQVTARLRDVEWDGFFLRTPDIELGSGALWVANRGGDSGEPVIWKVDSESGEIAEKLRLARPMDARIATGERILWVANRFASFGEANRLLGVDPETAQVSSTIELHNAGLDVAVTDGAVWVLHPDATISRIDPSTNRVSGVIRLPDSDSGSSFLTAGSGAIWLAAPSLPPFLPSLFLYGPSSTLNREERPGAELARLDPGENRIVERIPFGGELGPVMVADVVVGGHSVWVSLIVLPKDAMHWRSDDAIRDSEHWLAEIDSRTNQLAGMVPLGQIGTPAPRLAVVEDDLFVCGASIWRIPMDALRAAFLPRTSGPAN